MASRAQWPDATEVVTAARRWAQHAAADASVLAVGYVGSYARGDWGVGSHLDLVVIVDQADAAVEQRALRFDATMLPVPVDLQVYEVNEWDALARDPSGAALHSEVRWLLGPEVEDVLPRGRSTASKRLVLTPATHGSGRGDISVEHDAEMAGR